MRAKQTRAVVLNMLTIGLAAMLTMLALGTSASRAEVSYPSVVPNRAVEFPRDHGSHPEFRTEWWYITGWVEHDRVSYGIQITFFRNRPGVAEQSSSAFAARQLLFAHVALADPRLGRLRHDQRAARAGMGLAFAREGVTDVAIDDWRLQLDGGTYRATLPAREFGLDLTFDAASPPLLQGEHGFSRKGPRIEQASYYYSRPQLSVAGTITIGAQRLTVTGRAWLDHEWSSELMATEARGWDWLGINLDDGGALMAFQMRSESGAPIWSTAIWQRPDGSVQTVPRTAIVFAPKRRWRSPRTSADYPVELEVHLDGRRIALAPLFDDQELDARASVGAVYWEGAVIAREAGQAIGRGYLELTGYWRRLRL